MLSARLSSLLAAFIATTGLLGAGASSASAQSGPYGGYSPGWSGYAPAYTWGGYAPGGYVTAAPAPSVAAPAPTVAAAPRPATGWSGYAPATAWQGYRPEVAWQGYVPGRVVTGYATAPARPSAATTISRPANYREFGTGRTVFLHKPWLPGQG